ncbi:unnamed protein product [Closterium sp. NIES-64]|nr:unnamed protein product [Closterium sp. NIES-64]
MRCNFNFAPPTQEARGQQADGHASRHSGCAASPHLVSPRAYRQAFEVSFEAPQTLSNYDPTVVCPALPAAPPIMTLRNYDPTVSCPASNTSCVVEQRDYSPFCTACAAFCSSCIKAAPGGVTAASSSSSGLTTGAIVGIVVGVLLLVVGIVAAVFIVIQCSNRSKEVEVEYTTQPEGAYAGDNHFNKLPQDAYAGYQPGAAGQV